MEEIHVDKLMNNTIQFMLTSLTKTEAHVGQLLAKTGDKPGYEDATVAIDGLKELILDYRDERDY